MVSTHFFLLLFIAASLVASAPFNVRDLHDLASVSETAMNNDRDIIYTVHQWKNKQKLYHQANQGPLTLLLEDDMIANPVFYQDGIAFLSRRNGGAVNIYNYDLGSGNVTQLSDFVIDVTGMKYSEAGAYFVVSMDVFPECHSLQCTKDKQDEIDARGSDGWYYFTKLYVRHWDVLDYGRVSHLFTFKLGETPVDIMDGLVANSPIPPFGGGEQYDISPDENVESSKAAWTTGWNINIYHVDTAETSCITTHTEARTTNPVFSPGSDRVAYLAMDVPGFEADKLHINIYDISSNKTREYDQIDISFSTVLWLNDDFLLADADYFGAHSVFYFDLSNGNTTVVIPKKTNSLVSCTTNSDCCMLVNTMNRPNEVYSFHVASDGLVENYKRESNATAAIDKFELNAPINITYANDNGDMIQGWMVHPYNFDESKEYKTVVLIHGAWGNDWSTRWNPQLWAQAGYVTVMFNIHGSTGFGQNFTDAVSRHWGGLPFQDLLAGVKYIKNFQYVDEDYITACGASYGGYMINWILGNTDAFARLVVHDGVFDTRSFYYSTDELWFAEHEFGGLPWENPDGYEKWNPSLKVDKWTTPTLVIHGGKDYRIDLSQGLSTFTGLQRQGIESKFLYFPEENHWVLNPLNGIKWYDTVLEWLDAGY